MPLPFILGAIGVGSAILGAAGHAVAKEDNEKAQSIARKAESIYMEAKKSLEREIQNTEEAMASLGNEKLKVLDTSMNTFIRNFDRVKRIQLGSSTGLNDLSNLQIDEQGVLKMRELSNIYGVGTFASGVGAGIAGAATGSAIALAASGCLPVVTSMAGMAGSLLTLGEVGLAASMAGSAISVGLSATPLAAAIGPAVLVSAFAASFKADENVEKAETMLKEAKAAAEEMKVSETLCKGISEKSRMFEELLRNLNQMFSPCVDAMAEMLDQKTRLYGSTLNIGHLSKEEQDLLMVTRALAGAVKSVIDIPLLDKDGKLMDDLDRKYNVLHSEAPNLKRVSSEVMHGIQS